MCGVTTGGREECFWDCDISDTFNGTIITAPECLIDCFPDTEEVCKIKHGLDRGSIRSSLRYGLRTPHRLTIRNSSRLFHIVLFNLADTVSKNSELRGRQHPSRRTIVPDYGDLMLTKSTGIKNICRGKLGLLNFAAFYKGKHTLD